jgi:hypothetical protein
MGNDRSSEMFMWSLLAASTWRPYERLRYVEFAVQHAVLSSKQGFVLVIGYSRDSAYLWTAHISYRRRIQPPPGCASGERSGSIGLAPQLAHIGHIDGPLRVLLKGSVSDWYGR